jgi:hypothetical protein
MKGYIYTMYEGADPGHGFVLNDPIFGDSPTLGACVPNIRRAVQINDYIFVVSGRVKNERQFVVGGFRVKEKISTLAAYKRFPQNRIQVDDDGRTLGNIIVDGKGKHHPLDDHDHFKTRVDNYIVGGDPIVLSSAAQQQAARDETIPFLEHLFGKKGARVFDIIGRHRKMTEDQVKATFSWLRELSE